MIKELNHRVQKNKEDTTTKDLANVLFETATLRSGFSLQETASFAERIERMLRLSLDVPLDAKVSRISSLPTFKCMRNQRVQLLKAGNRRRKKVVNAEKKRERETHTDRPRGERDRGEERDREK